MISGIGIFNQLRFCKFESWTKSKSSADNGNDSSKGSLCCAGELSLAGLSVDK